MKKLRDYMDKRVACALFVALALTAPALASGVEEINGLLQAGKYDVALVRASALLEKTPDDAQGRFLKGLSLVGLGKRTEAIAVFDALSRDFPTLSEPYNNLAALHAAGGDYDSARAALEKAVKADPGYAIAHANLGDLYVQLAQNAYARVLQLDPGNALVAKRHAALARPPHDVKAMVATKTAVTTAGHAHAETEAVLAVVGKWAEAWSARDVGAYLSFYAPEFRTPRQQSRHVWETGRRKLIENKKKIDVEVAVPQVTMEGDTATVRFRQTYHSDAHVSVDRKTLVLRAYEDGWKILEERSEK